MLNFLKLTFTSVSVGLKKYWKKFLLKNKNPEIVESTLRIGSREIWPSILRHNTIMIFFSESFIGKQIDWRDRMKGSEINW